MPVTLQSSDYPEIRAAIDISLDAGQLPDTIIGLAIYKTAAEQWVAAQTTYTGTEARLAAILYCASLIAPQVPAVIRELAAGGEITLRPLEYADIAGRLLARAYHQIVLAKALETPTIVTDNQPTLFMLGQPYRSPYDFD